MAPSSEHLALREEVYRTLGTYHQASSAYWLAVSASRDPVDPERLADVRTTALALDGALNELLHFLRQAAPSDRVIEEGQRMAHLQELLAHELTLLPATE